MEGAARFCGDIGQEGHVGGVFAMLDIGVGRFAAFDASQHVAPDEGDVLVVGFVEGGILVDGFFFGVIGVKCPTFLPTEVQGTFGAVEIDTDVFALAFGAGVVERVFPCAGKVFKFKDGSLFFRGVSVAAAQAFFPSGENATGHGFFRPPQNLIEPVRSPIAYLSVGESHILSEPAWVDTIIIRH